MKSLSIIIPVYFNEGSIAILYRRLVDVTDSMSHVSCEFVFVDDGSEDKSFELLEALSNHDERIKIIKLTRNFGAFVACLAGLNYATGDGVVVMAADLQDPPELIPKLYEKWKDGNQVVCAVRKSRGDGKLKVVFSNMYYRLVRLFALSDVPKGGFDFVLVDRVVVDLLNAVKEKNTSIMGLIVWTGFQKEYIYYEKEKRPHGQSKWSLSKKINYFIDTFFSFGQMPLRFIMVLGSLMAGIAFTFLIFIIIQKAFFGISVQGFATLAVIILFTAGFQMIMLGVVCEYVWRNLEETRKRPLFIVDKLIGQFDD